MVNPRLTTRNNSENTVKKSLKELNRNTRKYSLNEKEGNRGGIEKPKIHELIENKK